jgi:predicted PurR-regulated permease PerM
MLMKSLNQPMHITITAGTFLKGIMMILLFWLLFVIRDLLLVILTSIVLASAIEPGTQWFTRRKVPRTMAVLTIYILVILLFAAIFYFFVPTLVGDVNDILDTLPAYLETLTANSSERFASFPALQSFVDEFASGGSGDLFGQIQSGISGATLGFLSTASSIFGGIVSFVLIIVISFYLAVQEDGVTNFLRIVIPIEHEKYIVGLWKRSQRKIGLWMQGQLILGILIGVLTYLGLSILGIENALFLALIAAVFELIPLFGPILAAIPAVGFALVQGGLTLGLLVLGLYLIIQQFESQLIHPLVVKKIVGIPALIAIIALIVGGQIAGFLGIILSVPVAAAVMEYITDIEKKKAADLEGLKEMAK